VNRRHLWAMTRAAAQATYGDKPLVTIVTSPVGERYAAWDVGCVALSDRLQADLDDPADGTYRMFAVGGLRLVDHTMFTPDFVRDRMLPLLDRPDRTPVQDSGWMRDAGYGLVHRIITGPDGNVAVNQPLWAAWSAVTTGVVWQLGHPVGALVWAAERERATALILPIRLAADPTPPEAVPDHLQAVPHG
jgi:hypothetical protein